jgi:predicted metal-dependent hydrolase
MTSRKSEVRIRGLVRHMNYVRDALQAGIAPDGQDTFRAGVRDTIDLVDRICAAHHITPAQLPAPSRKAYDYLRSLDLSHLPLPTGSAQATTRKLRISGVLTRCQMFQEQFAELVDRSEASFTSRDPRVQKVSSEILHEAETLDRLCRGKDFTPADLPPRSRRGYQWMRFLSNPSHLANHLQTQHYLTERGRRWLQQDPSSRHPAFEVQIALTSMLYQLKAEGSSRFLLIHEGFITAPKATLNDLLQTVQKSGRAESAARRVKAYAACEAFKRIGEELHAAIADQLDRSGLSRGRHHDLSAAFERVNRRYFEGTMERPHLQWSRSRTHRKFGHYSYAEDTVMVSRTLDDAQVPAYVVDYIVYHELLHKSLGVKLSNGRRHAHTAAFRRAERAYDHYREARRFLSTLSQDNT